MLTAFRGTGWCSIHIPRWRTFLKWVFVLVTACLAGLTAFGMGVVISNAYRLRAYLIRLAEGPLPSQASPAVYFGFNLACCVVSCGCCLLLSKEAVGSGIPELVTYLNGVEVPGFLSMRTFIAKVMGATLAVSASLPCGYQGVLLHIGASIASLLAKQLPFDVSALYMLSSESSTSSRSYGRSRAASPRCTGLPAAPQPAASLSKTAGSPDSARSASPARRRHRAAGTEEVVKPLLRSVPKDVDLECPPSPSTPHSPRAPRALAGWGGSWISWCSSSGPHRLEASGIQSERLSSYGNHFWPREVDNEPFFTEQQHRDLVACGAAAGVSAAFKAPIGGILYIMELSTQWRHELTWRTFFACGVTALVLQTCIADCEHSKVCGFFAGGVFQPAQMEFSSPYWEMPWIILLAAGGGVLGVLFIQFNGLLCRLRRDWWGQNPRLLMLETVLLSITCSSMNFVLPLLGSCFACENPDRSSCGPGSKDFDALTGFLCKPGEYNDLAVLTFNPAGDAQRALYTAQFSSFSLVSLFLFAFFYFLVAAWTSGSCMPTGMFTPSLLFGSTYGRIFAQLLHRSGLVRNPDAGLYALLGAASFFGGVVRITVSLVVILLEMTHAENTLPFLMVAVVIAKGLADRFADGVIVTRIRLRNAPFLVQQNNLVAHKSHYCAADVMTGISSYLPVQMDRVELESRLQKKDWQLLPVVAHVEVPAASLAGLQLAGRTASSGPVPSSLVSSGSVAARAHRLEQDCIRSMSAPQLNDLLRFAPAAAAAAMAPERGNGTRKPQEVTAAVPRLELREASLRPWAVLEPAAVSEEPLGGPLHSPTDAWVTVQARPGRSSPAPAASPPDLDFSVARPVSSSESNPATARLLLGTDRGPDGSCAPPQEPPCGGEPPAASAWLLPQRPPASHGAIGSPHAPRQEAGAAVLSSLLSTLRSGQLRWRRSRRQTKGAKGQGAIPLFVGLVLREELEALYQQTALLPELPADSELLSASDGDAGSPSTAVSQGFTHSGCGSSGSGEPLASAGLVQPDSSPEGAVVAQAHMVDLSPVIRTPPMVISPAVTMKRVYTLFNLLGVEVLPVVGQLGDYLGLITRSEVHAFQTSSGRRV